MEVFLLSTTTEIVYTVLTKKPPGFNHSKQESGAKSLSTFQLSAVEMFELSFLTGEYHL